MRPWMSSFLPAPSMIVVFSFSTRSRFDLPNMSRVTFSSLMPRSSLITWPPVRMAISSSIALRRSPNPGALTAATLRPPRSLLTTRVAKASPSTSSATSSNGLPRLDHRLEQRQQRLKARQLLFVEKDVRLVQLGHHLLGIGHKVGADIAAVELHPFDHVELGLERFGFFDRDHPLIADLLHRLGDHSADLAVIVGRDRADLRDFIVGRDFLGPFSNLRHHDIDRSVDAALQIHWVHAGSHCLGALAHNR